MLSSCTPLSESTLKYCNEDLRLHGRDVAQGLGLFRGGEYVNAEGRVRPPQERLALSEQDKDERYGLRLMEWQWAREEAELGPHGFSDSWQPCFPSFSSLTPPLPPSLGAVVPDDNPNHSLRTLPPSPGTSPALSPASAEQAVLSRGYG